MRRTVLTAVLSLTLLLTACGSAPGTEVQPAPVETTRLETSSVEIVTSVESTTEAETTAVPETAPPTTEAPAGTLAGVKINFTDKGKKEILSGDKSRYHGLPTLMLMGKTAPEVKGDITMQKGTKGLMSRPDTFTCPISFGLKAPDGVDSKIVAAYLKAYAPFAIPRDTEIRLVWNEKENAFEKGY